MQLWTVAAVGIGYRRCMAALHVPDEALGSEHEERVAWMRAEFRAAQLRRYEKAAIVLANRTITSKSGPAPEAEPPPAAARH